MKHFPFLLAIVMMVFTSCGDDPASDPPTGSEDAECPGELSYRLTISNDEGQVMALNSSEFDASTPFELKRLRSFVWGIDIEGTRGLSVVELGLPGSSCSTTWTKSSVFPSGAPSSLAFNTGEPLLTGHRWKEFSLSGLARFPNLTVEGEIKTALVRENFELLVRIIGPEDDAGDQCAIDHLIPFVVVK